MNGEDEGQSSVTTVVFVGVMVALVVVAIGGFFAAPWLADELTGTLSPSLTDAEREDLQLSARTSIVEWIFRLALVVPLLLTAWLAWRRVIAIEGQLDAAQRQVEIAQDGQITERFTTAVEQLGSDRPEIRLGGLVALEAVAQDAPERMAATVYEVLVATFQEWVAMQRTAENFAHRTLNEKQTVLRILGRNRGLFDRWIRADTTPVFLAPDEDDAQLETGSGGPNLTGTDLSGSNLDGLSFVGAKFRDADLSDSSITDTAFVYCSFVDTALGDLTSRATIFDNCLLRLCDVSITARIKGPLAFVDCWLDSCNFVGTEAGPKPVLDAAHCLINHVTVDAPMNARLDDVTMRSSVLNVTLMDATKSNFEDTTVIAPLKDRLFWDNEADQKSKFLGPPEETWTPLDEHPASE